jgi:hypothetical protein
LQVFGFFAHEDARVDVDVIRPGRGLVFGHLLDGRRILASMAALIALRLALISSPMMIMVSAPGSGFRHGESCRLNFLNADKLIAFILDQMKGFLSYKTSEVN